MREVSYCSHRQGLYCPLIMNCPYPSCSKRFCSKYSLERHYNAKHLKIRPHFCQFCFRSFASKQNRLTHEYIHRPAALAPLPTQTSRPLEAYFTQIQPLTQLLKASRDSDLRPFASVRKIYYWPEGGDKVQLPSIHPTATYLRRKMHATAAVSCEGRGPRYSSAYSTAESPA